MNTLKKLALSATLILATSFANAELVAQYNFDGNALDSSGNGNDGHTSAGTAPITYSSDTYNDQGSAARFTNNSALSLDTSYSEAGSIGALSLSVFFKTGFSSATQFSNWSFLDFDRSEYFNLSLSGEGKVAFSMTTGNRTTTDILSNRSDLNDNAWHHAYVSYGSTNGLKISIDGQLDLSAAYKGAIGSGTTRYGIIGDGSEASSFDGTRNKFYYDGLMDNLSYWDNEDALNASELSAISSPQYSASVVPVALVGLLPLLGLLASRRRSSTPR
jgi:hypothetical protein